MTFTGIIGTICMFPLRAIIRACVVLRIHPNVLTFVGVLINVAAAWALATGRFVTAGGIMIAANIFDFIDGKVAREMGMESAFGGFWDSVMDRFSDLALFLGLVYLYSSVHRTDYVVITVMAMIFTVLTSYARARAESVVAQCKVGFMERPERIVLFMIGAFTNRMAGGALGHPRAVDPHRRRPHLLHVARARAGQGAGAGAGMSQPHDDALQLHEEIAGAGTSLPQPLRAIWRTLYWTYERATWQYDLMVIAILAFVWLTPPSWIGDPHASGLGPIGWLAAWLRG